MTLLTAQEIDFGIEIQYQPDTPDPSRVFRSMTDLIHAFERFDRHLIVSIDSSIQPILLLQEIEAGSLRSWFRDQLVAIDDSALKDGDWKKILGHFLVRGKYLVVKRLENKTSIISKSEVEQLEAELLYAAEETNVRRIPGYERMSRRALLESVREISAAVANLDYGDSAKLLTSGGEADFNLDFDIAPETLDELTVEESIFNTEQMILRVKKPDFLGDSRWEFIHERSLEAKILDVEWLQNFRSGGIALMPGDSIRALVQVDVHYGIDHEVVSKSYQVLRVIEVLHKERPSQDLLPGL
jgi:hypothetical protein